MVINKNLIVFGKLRYLKDSPRRQADAGAGNENEGIPLPVKLVIEVYVIDFDFTAFYRLEAFHLSSAKSDWE
jgi:hypothetical protein